MRASIIIIISGALGLVPPLPAAEPVPAAGAPRPLVVGFLDEGTDFDPAAEVMEAVRRALLAREEVRRALREAGFDDRDLILSPCNGPTDQTQRMGQGEFDLVFTTAVVYARHVAPYAAQGADPYYEPILQSYRPDEGDVIPPGRGGGPLRTGVVFAGPGSPLMRMERLTTESIRAELLRAPLAVASADSAAGYLYPRLRMAELFGVSRPADVWFCGSDDEVVKHVVTGLAPLGAAREARLRVVLGDGDPERFVRVLFRTLPYPTDPIVLRRALLPAVSPLGRAIKAALREVFRGGPPVPGLRVEESTRRDFETLAGYLADLDERRPGLTERPTAAPAATPSDRAAPALPTPALPPIFSQDAATSPSRAARGAGNRR